MNLALEDINFSTKNDVFWEQTIKDYGPAKVSNDFFKAHSGKLSQL